MLQPENQTPAALRQGPMALGLLVAVLAGFIGIAGPAQMLNLSWGLWFGEVFVFLGIPFVALRLVGREGDSRQLSRGFTWQFALFGFVIGTINYVAWAVPLMSLAQAIFPKSMVELFDGSAIFKNQRPLEIAAIVAGVSIAAPIGEEFFFRGVIQRGLFTWLGPRGAILLTAAIFSAFHLDPVGFMARFELGALFGFLAWRTGSLWPGIFAHAANNFVSVLAFFLTRDGARPENDVPWSIPAVMLIIGNAFMMALWRAWPHLLKPKGERPLLEPPKRFSEVVTPWLAAAGAALALLLALDFRGVALNVYDATHPLPKGSGDSIRSLRTRARAAEAGLSEYFEAHRALKHAEALP